MIDLQRWARFWGYRTGDVIELQSLGVKVKAYSLNYFAHAFDVETLIALAIHEDSSDEKPTGIYLLANAPNPVVATRDEPGQWHRMKAGESTTDLNMLDRRVLYIDVDAERPSGTSATEAELGLAQALAIRIHTDLAALIDPNALALGHSGNGAAVLVALDYIPESPEVEATIKAIIIALAGIYDAPGVKIDRKVFDAKRLLPCWGTVKRKGVPNLAERPHRRTMFVCEEHVTRLSLAELVKLCDVLAPPEPSAPATTKNAAPSPFDRVNDVAAHAVATWLGIVTGEGVKCPGCGETQGVALLDRGLFCHHNRCASKGKSGFRSNVDLVAEVKNVTPLTAVRLLSEQFGLGVFISDYTESGFAEIIAATRAQDLRFVTSWGHWIAWDGARWSLDRGREIAELAPKRVAELLFARASQAESDEKAKMSSGAAIRLRARKTRDATLSLARWELALHHSALDHDADHLLVTPSGTVDLRTGIISPNDPSRFLTHVTSVAYDPHASCPNWERFVAQVAGADTELVGYLQRAAGYSLTASIAEHVVFFLFGEGANGKTTYVETLRYVLGDYTRGLRSETLMASDRTQHPTAWASLVGARLVMASEIEKGARFAESLFKSITGGDEISCRRMREDFWSFAPQFKLWILANDKPVVRGTDEGIWRRLRLVPFTVSFLGREDKQLKEKLQAEASGILRWCVDGARAWYAYGLCEPKSVRAATDAYRAEQDVFGLWVRDEIEIAPARTALSAELRSNYEQWCKSNGAHPIGLRDYAERLMRLGAVAKRGNRGRFWEGVGVISRVGPMLRSVVG